MHPDDDSQLRPAFAELHRRQRAEAPSFEPMRDRAMRAANAERVVPAPSARMLWLRVAACAAAVFGLIALIWQVGPGSQPVRPKTETAASAKAVDQLIDRIEQHVEIHSALALPDYPSDVLLSPPGSDSSL
jgi:hypothetical protein